MKIVLKKVKDLILKNLKWIILFLSLIEFLWLLEGVFSEEILDFDLKGYTLIKTYLMSDFTTSVFKVITNLGGGLFIIVLAFSLFLIIKRREVGLVIFANLGIITLLNLLLKNIVSRPRPSDFRIIEESGYSFPSGHSMISMAFYGLLIYLIYKNFKNKYIKWSLIVVLSLLIILIGISRVYLGVHYLSDVLAGFLLAISYLIIYISVINKYILERLL